MRWGLVAGTRTGHAYFSPARAHARTREGDRGYPTPLALVLTMGPGRGAFRRGNQLSRRYGCLRTADERAAVRSEENKKLVRRLVDDVVNVRNPDALDEFAEGEFAEIARRWIL